MQNMDYWQLVHEYRRELGFGICAAIIAACVHIQRGDPRRVWITEAILAGVIGSSADLLLGLCGVTNTRAGIFLVFVVGFVGARTIVAYIMNRLGFKFSFEKVDTDTTKP